MWFNSLGHAVTISIFVGICAHDLSLIFYAWFRKLNLQELRLISKRRGNGRVTLHFSLHYLTADLRLCKYCNDNKKHFYILQHQQKATKVYKLVLVFRSSLFIYNLPTPYLLLLRCKNITGNIKMNLNIILISAFKIQLLVN